MVTLKAILALSILGYVNSQDASVFNAYSPGQQYSASPTGGLIYKATPRLVPIKVKSSRERDFSSVRTTPIQNISPFSLSHHDQNISPQYQQNIHQNQHLYQARRQPSSPTQLVQQTAYTLPKHVRIRAQSPYDSTAQSNNGQYYEPGQVLRAGTPVLKRVRVQSPYAAALEQPVEFSNTVSAVSTYKQPQYTQQAVLAQQPQPAYYAVPRQQQQQLQQGQRPVLVKQGSNPRGPLRSNNPSLNEDEIEEKPEYASDPNPQYNFAFDVKDDELTNYQNRQEQRQDGIVKGSYSVVDPDGYVRTVTYTASPKGGFQAKVTRELTDVKIKFPVPTEAPEQVKGEIKGQNAYAPQPQQYQQQQYQPQPLQGHYAAQPQPGYLAGGGGRFPQQGHRLVARHPQQ